MVLLISFMSATVAVFILELILETWKLISGREMFESQLSLPIELLMLERSSSSTGSLVDFRRSAEIGMGERDWAYESCSMDIDISGFCVICIPTYLNDVSLDEPI